MGINEGNEKSTAGLVQQYKGCEGMRLLPINTFGRGHAQERGKGYFRALFAWEEKMDVGWSQGNTGLEFKKRLPPGREVSIRQAPRSSSEWQNIDCQRIIDLWKKG